MIPGTGSLSSTHAGLFGKGKEIYNDDVDRKRGGGGQIYLCLLDIRTRRWEGATVIEI